MNPRDPFEANDVSFDDLDKRILQALKEEGVIIPKTVEEVRSAKARLKTRPVTVPARLRNSEAILHQLQDGESAPDTKVFVEHCAPVAAKSEVAKPAYKANVEFVEAVLIAQLTRSLSQPDFPLGRLRYNKLAYLSHRRAEENVTEYFLKKAAGPYSPWARYQGPEKIALQNGYVKRVKVGVLEGLVVGDHIENIDRYLSHYPVCGVVDWVVDKFRFRKKEELELLATVDFAALDLKRVRTFVGVEAIKDIIATNKEWAPKLNRAVFSDTNISRALTELRGLFPKTYS
jgi:hypothetical protein